MSPAVSLTLEVRAGLRVATVPDLGARGVDAFVTAREGGVSRAPYDELNLAEHVGDDPAAVAENRRRVAAAIGVDPTRLVTMNQVHGARVVEVTGPGRAEADALVTSARDLAVAVLVADCVPILLVDAVGPRLGVVHAGWRGLDAGVVEAALRAFAHPARLRALIGPSISGPAYQVGPEVAERFADVPGARVRDVGDRWLLDLRVVAHHRLVAAGLEEAHVWRSAEVTDGGRTYFSDRAQRPSGRFALVARVALA